MPKPAPGSREAQLEKRREVGNKLHSAARDREATADGLDVGEAVTLGGGNDYQRALAAKQAREAKLQASRAERLSAAQERERATMAKIMAEVGFDPGQTYQIRPREPGQ